MFEIRKALEVFLYSEGKEGEKGEGTRPTGKGKRKIIRGLVAKNFRWTLCGTNRFCLHVCGLFFFHALLEIGRVWFGCWDVVGKSTLWSWCAGVRCHKGLCSYDGGLWMVLNMLMYWIDTTDYILIVLPVLVKNNPKIYVESPRFRNSSAK